jgi:hypothetical protein
MRGVCAASGDFNERFDLASPRGSSILFSEIRAMACSTDGFRSRLGAVCMLRIVPIFVPRPIHKVARLGFVGGLGGIAFGVAGVRVSRSLVDRTPLCTLAVLLGDSGRPLVAHGARLVRPKFSPLAARGGMLGLSGPALAFDGSMVRWQFFRGHDGAFRGDTTTRPSLLGDHDCKVPRGPVRTW